MKSFSRRRHSQPYVQAEALVDARNKVFNVIMAVLLVLTMLPITAFTYESQASAETLDSNGTTQVSEYSDDSSNSSGGSTSNSLATTSSGSSDGESSSSENADGGYPSTAVDPLTFRNIFSVIELRIDAGELDSPAQSLAVEPASQEDFDGYLTLKKKRANRPSITKNHPQRSRTISNLSSRNMMRIAFMFQTCEK